MKKLLFLLTLPLLWACSDEIPTVNLGIDDTYRLPRMTKLPLRPALTGAAYRWSVTGPDGVTAIVADTRDYVFLAAEEGTYKLRLEILDPETPYEFTTTVNVVHEEVEYSPYIAKVYDYRPAPGQFVNEMPRWEEGDTYADILKKAEECISGKNDVMITLGAYGGYVTFGFDHTVMNRPEEPDFRIWGNAFYELLQPDKKGGSAEPGIVMVSYDANCNGQPDDPWYELAGSEYFKPQTRHGYTITYTRGETDHHWTDSEGNSGAVWKNEFHGQPYWPRWLDADTMTFSGSRLADNYQDLSGEGTYYVLYAYEWGYVDNHPNDYAALNSFDIDRAVDGEGKPIKLPGVDFIRVYTGLNQYCGWLGETSTEICRAQDLSINE